MAQIKVNGEQLDIQDVANDIANDANAIGSIATGVTSDPGATATLDADYLRRDGTTLMLGNLDLGAFNLVTSGTIDGRNVSVDGVAQDAHIADVTLHRIINDAGTLTTELFSASKIIADLVLKSDTTHVHALNDLTDATLTASATNEALVYNGAAWVNAAIVNSFNGRTGVVVPTSADYPAALISNTPYNNIAATTVQAAINELDDEKIATGSSVSVGGIDIFNTKNVNDLEFNGIAAGAGGEISVTLDGANFNVVIDANPVIIATGFAFGDVSDVTFTTEVLNDYLRFNGSDWVNTSFATSVTTELNANSIDALSDVDTTTTTPSLNEVLVWDGSNWVPTTNPVGVTDFIGLTDTPGTYVSNANQFVIVNAGETGLEFTPAILDNLFDVVLTGSPAPVVYDALVFDGSNWTHQVVDHVNILNIGTNTHAQIDTHIAGTALNHTAADITNVAAGNISAADVQAALNELDTEKAPLASPTFTGVPVLPLYTLVTLPTVVDGGMIYVTDATAASSGVGAMCFGRVAGSPDEWIDVTTGLAVV